MYIRKVSTIERCRHIRNVCLFREVCLLARSELFILERGLLRGAYMKDARIN